MPTPQAFAYIAFLSRRRMLDMWQSVAIMVILGHWFISATIYLSNGLIPPALRRRGVHLNFSSNRPPRPFILLGYAVLEGMP
ncbi:unnamed protein product [Nezara viridula]|uniref:Uncharacterized protein n=1 Tax=Nezara viridula TaxID=85310 RepID=A0A9P0DVT6_NEZVI|nr:unnamed protein product [Nezara viridula]